MSANPINNSLNIKRSGTHYYITETTLSTVPTVLSIFTHYTNSRLHAVNGMSATHESRAVYVLYAAAFSYENCFAPDYNRQNGKGYFFAAFETRRKPVFIFIETTAYR